MKTQEQAKREMYAALDKIRRAKKHPSATAVFETALESYLEAVRVDHSKGAAEQLLRERDELQGRLHAVDAAYVDSQKLNTIAGEELRQAQYMAKHWKEDSDRRCQQLNDQSVQTLKWKTKAAEQLIVIKSQREAFGELYVKHHAQQRNKCQGPAPLTDARGSDCGFVCGYRQQ